MSTDLHYVENNFWMRLIPMTEQGQYIYETISKSYYDGDIPIYHKTSLLSQIRRAGYSVKKAPKVTDKELNKILEELELTNG